MKNFKFVLFMIATLAIGFSSCSKDEDTDPVDQTPNINFKGGSNYISADATVVAGEDFVIGITASSNSDSGKDLVSVKYTVTANNSIVHEHDSVFKENNYDVDYGLNMSNAGVAVFKFEVTDKNGEKSSISLTITAEAATTPLGDPETVLWERVGGVAATGLDTYGLKWENNVKTVHAIIEKEGAGKLVQLTANEWTSISTQEDLMAAIEAGTDLEKYEGISAEASGIYDEVLAVSFNGEYFLIHLTSSEINVDGNGTTIKINGESKK